MHTDSLVLYKTLSHRAVGTATVTIVTVAVPMANSICSYGQYRMVLTVALFHSFSLSCAILQQMSLSYNV